MNKKKVFRLQRVLYVTIIKGGGSLHNVVLYKVSSIKKALDEVQREPSCTQYTIESYPVIIYNGKTFESQEQKGKVIKRVYIGKKYTLDEIKNDPSISPEDKNWLIPKSTQKRSWIRLCDGRWKAYNSKMNVQEPSHLEEK